MKVAFLITGIPRQFSKNLKLYIDSLSKLIECHIYLYFPKEQCDENYGNDLFNPETFISILNDTKYKLILLDTLVPTLPDTLTRKQKNSVIQWYRINKCFSYIPDEYDVIVRIRPDLKILINETHFIDTITNSIDGNIYIPSGFDTDKDHLNDQIAYGSYAIMKEYCSLFSTISYVTDYSSEAYLYKYLNSKSINIIRPSIPYKLALSDCKVIAIAGDSASGKSTLMRYIQEIMPQESYLSIETDSYHKWERSNENWKSYTHLNPEANHLERMSEDVLRLKIGSNVSLVEYDHSTGKFTQGKLTESKPFLILCGLHTLYQKSLLKNLDLKIFLDIEEDLKINWKIKRDTEERKYTVDKIMETIIKRKDDSEKYIQPQKNSADFIINYRYVNSELSIGVSVTRSLSNILHPFYSFFSDSYEYINVNHIRYILKNDISSSMILSKLESIRNKVSFIPTSQFQNGTTGILQFLIFLILFYNDE
jgi:uridine kinase